MSFCFKFSNIFSMLFFVSSGFSPKVGSFLHQRNYKIWFHGKLSRRFFQISFVVARQIPIETSDTPGGSASWKSHFGSLSFNTYSTISRQFGCTTLLKLSNLPRTRSNISRLPPMPSLSYPYPIYHLTIPGDVLHS